MKCLKNNAPAVKLVKKGMLPIVGPTTLAPSLIQSSKGRHRHTVRHRPSDYCPYEAITQSSLGNESNDTRITEEIVDGPSNVNATKRIEENRSSTYSRPRARLFSC